MTFTSGVDATTEQRRGTVTELGHVVLYVGNLARSVEFYGDVLGWSRVPTPTSAPVAMFSGGRTHHELLLIEVGPDAAPIPTGRRVGLYHFAVKVGDTDEDLLAAHARVVAAPHVARLVGATDHTVTHSLYTLDPDGNEVELYIDVASVDWRNNPREAMAPNRRLVIDGVDLS